jgi:hypothetical protein
LEAFIVDFEGESELIKMLPSQINEISNGKYIWEGFDIFGEEENSAVTVSEVSGGFGCVHGLVDDFYFLDILIFLIIEVGVGRVNNGTKSTGFFDVDLGQNVVKSSKLLVRSCSHQLKMIK